VQLSVVIKFVISRFHIKFLELAKSMQVFPRYAICGRLLISLFYNISFKCVQFILAVIGGLQRFILQKTFVIIECVPLYVLCPTYLIPFANDPTCQQQKKQFGFWSLLWPFFQVEACCKAYFCIDNVFTKASE